MNLQVIIIPEDKIFSFFSCYTYLLSLQVNPKYPSLQAQINVSTLTSIQVALLLQGALRQATQGSKIKHVLINICSKINLSLCQQLLVLYEGNFHIPVTVTDSCAAKEVTE